MKKSLTFGGLYTTENNEELVGSFTSSKLLQLPQVTNLFNELLKDALHSTNLRSCSFNKCSEPRKGKATSK